MRGGSFMLQQAYVRDDVKDGSRARWSMFFSTIVSVREGGGGGAGVWELLARLSGCVLSMRSQQAGPRTRVHVDDLLELRHIEDAAARGQNGSLLGPQERDQNT
jgi:hypothetical protein